LRARNKRKRQPIECSVEAVAIMIGCLPTQAIAFEWKSGFSFLRQHNVVFLVYNDVRTQHAAI